MEPCHATAPSSHPRTHQPSLIEQLPTSLLSHIASLCKGASKKALRATCRSFRVAVAIPAAIHLEIPYYVCEQTAHFGNFRKFIEANPQITAAHIPDGYGFGNTASNIVAMMLPMWDGIRVAHMPAFPHTLTIGLMSSHTNITSLTLGDPEGERGGEIRHCLPYIQDCTTLRELNVMMRERSGYGLNNDEKKPPGEEECAYIGEMTQLEHLSICTRSGSWRRNWTWTSMVDLNNAIRSLTRLSHLKLDCRHNLHMNDTALALEGLTNLKAFTWICGGLRGKVPEDYLSGLAGAGGGLTKLVCHKLQPLEVLSQLTGLMHLEVAYDGGEREQLSAQILDCCLNLTSLTLPTLSLGNSKNLRTVCLPRLEYLCVGTLLVGAFQTQVCIPNLHRLSVASLESDRPLSQVTPNLHILETKKSQPLPSHCFTPHPTLTELHLCIGDLLDKDSVVEDLRSMKTLLRLVVREGGAQPQPQRAARGASGRKEGSASASGSKEGNASASGSKEGHSSTARSVPVAAQRCDGTAAPSVLPQVTRLHITCVEPYGPAHKFQPLLAILPSLTHIRFNSEKPIDPNKFKAKKYAMKELPIECFPGIEQSMMHLTPALCRLRHLRVIELDASVMMAGRFEWNKEWEENPKDQSEGFYTNMDNTCKHSFDPWLSPWVLQDDELINQKDDGLSKQEDDDLIDFEDEHVNEDENDEDFEEDQGMNDQEGEERNDLQNGERDDQEDGEQNDQEGGERNDQEGGERNDQDGGERNDQEGGERNDQEDGDLKHNSKKDANKKELSEDCVSDKFLCRFLEGLAGSKSLRDVILAPGSESFEEACYHRKGSFRHMLRMQTQMQVMMADMCMRIMYGTALKDCFTLSFQ